jgi:hypothetical protein
VALARTKVSEELLASIIRMKRICELRRTLRVTIEFTVDVIPNSLNFSP